MALLLLSKARIDQLKASIHAAADGKSKLKALFAFCEEWDSYSPDTEMKIILQNSIRLLLNVNIGSICLKLEGHPYKNERLVTNQYK